MRIMVNPANEFDYEPWLRLSKEVESLFGPMADKVDFQNALKGILASQQAFCVRETDIPGSPLCGGIAIDRESNHILWLVVAGAHRGKGLGNILLQQALKALDPQHPIQVQTFADGVKEGLPARRLYLAQGFVDIQNCEPTPTGIPTVLMERPSISSMDN